MKNRTKRILILAVSVSLVLAGCKKSSADNTETAAATDSGHAAVSTVSLTEGKYSDEKLDAAWDEKSAVKIELQGSSIQTSGDGVTVEENKAVISKSGTYVLSGTLEDGQIVVDVSEKESVRLVLNGASLTSISTAPLYIKQGDVIITLAENTKNTVTDAQEYVYEEGETEPKAAIFAKDDLTFNGTGTLTVNGNYKNGIQSKDDLKFVTGTYKITAANHGIVGKDSVSVKNGNFTIEAGKDGIQATNTTDTDKGYVIIDGGSFTITAGTDGIQAETLLRVNDGTFDIVTGGGSQEAVQKMGDFGKGGMGGAPGKRPDGEEFQKPEDGEMPQMPEDGELPADGAARQKPENGEMSQKPEDGEEAPQTTDGSAPETVESGTDTQTGEETTETQSQKGLKSYVELIVAGGTFQLDTCDDGLHSNQNVQVDGGSLIIQTGDDGIHADKALTINSGTIEVQKSYEGLEGFDIVINGGDVKVTASDDGINAAGSKDSESEGETEDSKTAGKQESGQKPGQMGGGMAEEDQGATLTINEGTVYVSAQGDGLDANGDIFINGGTTTVQGPVSGGDGALDYASECKISGGTLLACGSVGMIQNPSDTSTQPVIVQTLGSTLEAGTGITIIDEEGNTAAQLTIEKEAGWFAISSPKLKAGSEYTVRVADQETKVTLDQTVTIVSK